MDLGTGIIPGQTINKTLLAHRLQGEEAKRLFQAYYLVSQNANLEKGEPGNQYLQWSKFATAIFDVIDGFQAETVMDREIAYLTRCSQSKILVPYQIWWRCHL
eukprot:4083437-Amphidinium_carterae.1